MKSKLAIFVLALAMAGCTYTHVQGPGWSASNNSFLWTRKGITGTINTNGTASFSEQETSPDAASIQILTQALVGLAQQAH